MASGDYTLTNYGNWEISSALLKTTVDTINIPNANISGSSVVLIPMADGRRVQVIKLERAA